MRYNFSINFAEVARPSARDRFVYQIIVVLLRFYRVLQFPMSGDIETARSAIASV